MMFIISARKSAPNDGTDPFGTAPNIGYRRSKQNSDAAGMMYQWGRKDPFTFAYSSLGYGKYPVKIYNGKRELIYQVDSGGDNTGKTPQGGIIAQVAIYANSMMETITNPQRYYINTANACIINQDGHSKELFNYYWTSYSRGTDGKYPYTTTWHNTYLDGYIVLRSKSIYDPCPYGYRTPANGTYNDFNSNPGWPTCSYTGGVYWNNSWFISFGRRGYTSELFYELGEWGVLNTSTTASNANMYDFAFTALGTIFSNMNSYSKAQGTSIRCIEDATGKADVNRNRSADLLACGTDKPQFKLLNLSPTYYNLFWSCKS